jgi:F-type H+-transporting ATPase subunit gamma
MAKARAITKRRRAVHNIRKITETMQLIATARYQRCLQRAVASQPYTQAITAMIQTLAGQPAADHPLLKPNADCDRSRLLVITSNRGLCGSYNAAVLRHLAEQREALAEARLTPTVDAVGKKGIAYLRFLGLEVADTLTDVEDRIAFGRVSALAERYMRLYADGSVARVEVVHMHFHSIGVQRPAVVQLLPIQPPQSEADRAASRPGPAPGRSRTPGPSEPQASASGSAAPGSSERRASASDLVAAGASPRSAGSFPARARTRVEFEFSPPPAELLARLIPETVKVRLFQCFNDAILSEQVARMVAMKAATDAAGDMIKFLTRRYNRARQTQITMELADIVGGANAVQ